MSTSETLSDPSRAILLLVGAMTLMSINDMLIKLLSDRYALHQIVLIRSSIGILFTLVFLRMEGGLRLLKTSQPGLHALRAALLVASNLFFFAGIAILPLAESSALFFVAPLMITLLQIPILGQSVGPRRIIAVLVGFAGVLIVLFPGLGARAGALPLWAMALPLAAAVCYALMQVLTRKLGAKSAASAMAIYVQATFVLVGAAFGLVAGDGAYAEGVTNPSLLFLLRAWAWPTAQDWLILGSVGIVVGLLGYTIAQAYRLGDPATLAPFEYTALPLAALWGLLIFGDLPAPTTLAGIALIAGSGIFIFLREGRAGRPGRGPVRR